MQQARTREQAILFPLLLYSFFTKHYLYMLRSPCPLRLIWQYRWLPIIFSLLCQVHQKHIPHCAICIFISGMNNKTRRLVDNEQVMILINDGYIVWLHEESIGLRS